jgi:hypothetical protein
MTKNILNIALQNPHRYFKTIEYAYPTSNNSEKFGFVKTGCYCVEVEDRLQNKQTAICAFLNKDDAKVYADSINLKYSPLYLKYN